MNILDTIIAKKKIEVAERKAAAKAFLNWKEGLFLKTKHFLSGIFY